MRSLPAATVLGLLMVIASAAQAEQRYVAPAGEGTACTSVQPCSLEEAVTKAKSGDEVILTAGSYAVSKAVQTPLGVEDLDIHGAAGGAMPTIVATTTYPAFAVDFRGSGGRLSYLAIEGAAAFPQMVRCTSGGRVERVRISASGSASAIGLLQAEDCMVRDSLVLAAGDIALALLATGGSGVHAGFARNVTAVGIGSEATAIASSYSGGAVPGSYTLDARNVIASGGGRDLRAGGGSFGVGHFQISNSNFETSDLEPGSTISGSANQTVPPLFVDPLGGDYRQAPGSPTIDAGSTDQIGPFDLDGNPRLLGAAPDIGAFEIAPPPGNPVPLTAAAAAGQIELLAVAPRRFTAATRGGAVLSLKKPPLGTTVSYSLTAAATVRFSIERRTVGRRVGKRCVKKTSSNAGRKCGLFKPVEGGFTHAGIGRANRFRFTGRLVKSLQPGSYRLTGATGESSRQASFKIVG